MACIESGQSKQEICVVAPIFVSSEWFEWANLGFLANLVFIHPCPLSQFNGLDKDKFGWEGKGSTGRLLVWKGNGVSISSFDSLSLSDPLSDWLSCRSFSFSSGLKAVILNIQSQIQYLHSLLLMLSSFTILTERDSRV